MRRRLNTALGFIWEWSVYPPLKKQIWREIDAAILKRFGARPLGRTVTRRAYRLEDRTEAPFLVVEFDDFAGGRFSFLGALGHGIAPDSSTVYSDRLTYPDHGSVCLVGAEVLIEESCTINIPLDWLTPPAGRVAEALRTPEARSTLDALGVTETDRHHLLSFGILESLGVKIEEGDYLPIADKARSLVASSVNGPVAQLASALVSARADTPRA